jgi:hypothetical protein
MLIETTMRYDPERDDLRVWPDRHDPFLVSRDTIEEVTGSTALSEDDLLAGCREHEAIFSDAAARKREDGEIDPDGRLVVTSTDLH